MTFRYWLPIAIACAAPFFGAAAPLPPAGEWLVADRTARVRIADCGDTLTGVISWERMPGGVDDKNPDPAKRGRPVLGMPILLNMKPSGANEWTGHIYNSDNGKIYSGGIRLRDANTLRITGCVLGFLCGGENWSRAVEPASGGLAPDAPTCATRAD